MRCPPPKVEYYTFGDTILITLEQGNNEFAAEDLLPYAYGIAWPSIFLGIESDLLLRGAISVGDFVRDETTVLGPALADAASWYEQADWIGIVATPRCHLQVYNVRSKDDLTDLDRFLLRQSEDTGNNPVPLHDRTDPNLQSIKWPNFYEYAKRHIKKHRGSDYRQLLDIQLSRSTIPIGTEGKYYNTRKYFHRLLATPFLGEYPIPKLYFNLLDEIFFKDPVAGSS